MSRPKTRNPATEQIGFRVTPDVKLELEAVSRALDYPSVSDFARDTLRQITQSFAAENGGMQAIIENYGGSYKMREIADIEQSKQEAFEKAQKPEPSEEDDSPRQKVRDRAQKLWQQRDPAASADTAGMK